MVVGSVTLLFLAARLYNVTHSSGEQKETLYTRLTKNLPRFVGQMAGSVLEEGVNISIFAGKSHLFQVLGTVSFLGLATLGAYYKYSG